MAAIWSSTWQLLERLRALGPRLLLPAHGPAIADPDRVLIAYLEHRRQRERQVLAALRGRPRHRAGDCRIHL